MVATNISSNISSLVSELQQLYPDIHFFKGHTFVWSSKDSAVYYKADADISTARWTLLHELGHAICEHGTYSSDNELIALEVDAWEEAKAVATKLGLSIPEDHIQDCLDTYRDWQYQRSMCPSCTQNGIQESPTKYKCINCLGTWNVTNSVLCRTYRKIKKTS